MRFFLCFLFLATLLAVPVRPSHAQDAPTAADSVLLGVSQAIPPLDVVLAAVGQRSPRVRAVQALVDKNEALVRRSRSAWLDQVTAGVTTTYGSYGNVLLDELNLGAQAGLTIRVSLFELFGRRHDTEVYRQEVSMARAQQESVLQDERADAIVAWHALVLAARQIEIRSRALESARLHEAMADRQFTQGDIEIGEMARVSEIASKAAADYEQARVEYLAAWARLENQVGVPLAELTGAGR